MPVALDISGQRYGRLTAIAPSGRLLAGKQIKTAWKFRCDCGAEIIRKLMNVRSGCTKSCGCLKKAALVTAGENTRLEFGLSSFRSLFYNYQRRAKAKKISFLLSSDEFRVLTSSPCSYCGVKPGNVKRAQRESFGEYKYNGVDRVDNSRGYELDNVVPCCALCNRCKRDMSRSEFLLWVTRVAAHSA